jgi:hypothetical protein
MRSTVARGSAALIVFLAIPLAAALSGCGSTKVMQPLAEASSTDARVYFIRKKYPPYIHAVRVSVNGTLLATLANDDYVAVPVPLGVNAVFVDAFDGDDLKFDLPVTTDPMYVLLTSDGYKTGTPYINADPVFAIALMDFNLKGYAITREEAQRLVAGFGKELK